jgi:peptidoglycan/LPS O-acetylase OafA/YrhL
VAPVKSDYAVFGTKRKVPRHIHAVGIVLGLLVGALYLSFPQKAAEVQMFALTGGTLWLLLEGIWEFRRYPRMKLSFCLAVLLHAVLLVCLRDSLPFRTSWPLFPILVVECMALLALIFKIIGV